MLRRRFFSLAVGITVAVSSVARATPVPAIDLGNGMALNVQSVVGSGQFTSYEVIDFADTHGQSFAWAYKYNTPVSGFQMLQDVATADPNLTVDAGFFTGIGYFVNNLTYGSNTGNADDFWRYLNGTYDSVGQTVDWTDSNLGAADVMISDGSFDGWYNSFDNDNPPALPEIAVPEPSVAGNIFVVGSICLLFLRKTRTASARSR